MSTSWSVRRIESIDDRHIDELANLLIDAVDGGASVSFMHPLTRERAVTFAQTPDGFSSFQERLLNFDVPAAQILVVIEATGSYWVALAVSLHEAGFRPYVTFSS